MSKKFNYGFSINKIGKQGKINAKANKEIDKLFDAHDIRHCEVGLPGCQGTFALTRCHRHKRYWYYGQPEKLWDYKQVVCACTSCHSWLETSHQLTEETFQRIRGDE